MSCSIRPEAIVCIASGPGSIALGKATNLCQDRDLGRAVSLKGLNPPASDTIIDRVCFTLRLGSEVSIAH